jgi:hypothetical protein
LKAKWTAVVVPTFTVTVVADEENIWRPAGASNKRLIVTGSGTYAVGATVNITASSNPVDARGLYTFDHWESSDIVSVPTTASGSFIMPNKNVTITAKSVTNQKLGYVYLQLRTKDYDGDGRSIIISSNLVPYKNIAMSRSYGLGASDGTNIYYGSYMYIFVNDLYVINNYFSSIVNI